MSHYLFTNNWVIGGHIKKQLKFLESVLPKAMLNREVDDLGCGDGKVTVLLQKILKPAKLRGFDVNKGLVKLAKERGIDAQIWDFDKDMPKGDMAVVWGVLHHLQDPAQCLRRLRENYPLIFIREPVRTGFFKGMELGNPMRINELTALFNNSLPGHQIHICGKSVLVFYGGTNTDKNDAAS
jgi:SAM-dependent methyltransferase